MAAFEENSTSSARIGVSPAKVIPSTKVVKMSDKVTIIPPDSGSDSRSPEVPCEMNQDTPEYIRRKTHRNRVAPVELFSQGDYSTVKHGLESKSPTCQSIDELEASLELQKALHVEDETGVTSCSLFSINVGGVDKSIFCSGNEFQIDNYFTGGDVITNNAQVKNAKEFELYQSARYGNFSYKFNLEPGDYLVDIHLMEIVFTDGPPGMRIFDIFFQQEKVVAGIDIYAQVGSNHPLVLNNLKATVVGLEGLLITFEGVVGKPLVCGINIKSSSVNHSQMNGDAKEIMGFEKQDLNQKEDTEKVKCKECKKMSMQYELLLKEQNEVRKTLNNVQKEYECKSKECHDALMSLHELKMELMRKSMHVGSLAFAVEGQVKEKARWFHYLQDLSKKFEMLKNDHTELLMVAMEYRKLVPDLAQITATIQSNLKAHADMEKDCRNLKQRFMEEARERRDLYNKLIELKGNIRVYCRCRPFNTEEIAGGAHAAVEFESAKDCELTVKVNGASKKGFKFDAVFSPEDNQGKVFEKTSPFATSVLDGYNVCIFAYGQTGTGKTFTMQGTETDRGVNYRTLQALFSLIEERQGLYRYELTVSVMEVYNEQIRDLLLPATHPGIAAKRLEVRQGAEGFHHVPGLIEAQVTNMDEAWEVLQTGSKARAVGTTNANEHSSRSHCIHCVMIKGENMMTGECTRSKLWLIDLAGSERVAKTDAQGERLKEAQNINKSLSALGDVISALATKSAHIPFRNSKLTHLLQDSLGGDSKTLMFVQISPHEDDVSETICSLNFASRVRGIELGPAKKQIDGSEMLRYKQMADKIKQDSKNKDCQIKYMEDTMQSLELKNKAKDIANKNLQEKIKELESQLLIERKLARQHVDNRIAEQQQQQQLQHQEQRASSVTSPFVRQPFSERKHNNGGKEQENVTTPLTDNKLIQHYPLLEDKENKSVLSEDPYRRAESRLSLCPTIRQVRCSPASRRNSLIPLPSVKPLLMQPNFRDLPPSVPMTLQGENTIRPKSNKKVSSILRRSLQKKVVIRSPMQHNIRRGVVGSAMEKKSRKVIARNSTRTDREAQQKEKERGWNFRTPEKNY